jgi:lipoprotein-anchoring transpeptidase ErfK/SrfK
VQRISILTIRAFVAVLCLLGVRAVAQEQESTVTLVVSVAEQKLAVLRDGGLLKKYPVSTSKYGLGDNLGSYKTPVGRLRVCEKIGDDLTAGTVLKARHTTGEVLPANAPGRDPIVTRIMWLDGLEPQNANAKGRGIYIHGTVEESKIGQPVSYGCIRMRSQDVVEVFEEVSLDTTVTIMAEKFPHYPKYTPPKPPVIVAAKPAPATIASANKAAPATAAPAPVAKGPITTPAPAIVAQTKPNLDKAGTKNPGASLAMQGSILDAGLPEGPKMLAPVEPKDVPRLSPYTPGLPADSAFSLQGIARDLSPVIRAADTDATAREAAAKAEKDAAAADSADPKPTPRVAFRAGSADDKRKQ